jgi:hypothetical protein
MRLTFLVLLATLPFCTCTLSQRTDKKVKRTEQRSFLMLQKKNKNKNVFYEKGDIISFQVKGRRLKITGQIIDFKDSVIVFQGYELKVSEIKCLYIDEKTKWWLRYKKNGG